MSKLVALTDGASIRDCIAKVLKGSSPAYIASPYWTKGTFAALGFTGTLNGKLAVLCDLRSGASDPAAIREMLERGASVVSVDRLHAKVYIGDGGVVVGSANATAAGLWHGSKAQAGNHEAAMCATSADAALPWLEWWRALAAEGVDLSNKQIANLLLDIAGQEVATAKPPASSLLKALIDGTYRDGALPLHVAIDWLDADDDVVEKAAELSEELHKTIGYWQRWSTMPKRANVISIMLEEDGSTWLEDVWRTPDNPRSAMDPATKAIYVSKVELVDGRYKLDQSRRWSRAARICVKDPTYRHHFRGNGTGVCLPIDEFVPYLKQAGLA